MIWFLTQSSAIRSSSDLEKTLPTGLSKMYQSAVLYPRQSRQLTRGVDDNHLGPGGNGTLKLIKVDGPVRSR